MNSNSNIDRRYGRRPPRGPHYGKYAGIVTDNSAPSDGSAHRGQVKVQVPGILEETADGTDNQPIEVLAAPSFLPGFFFVPDNDTNVWVEFVAGDINFPIWTGVWYPQDEAPQTFDGNAPTLDQKVIRTTSGHVIQLDDSGNNAQQLVINDETNDNNITSNSSGLTITSNTGGSSSGVVVNDETNSNNITSNSSGLTITSNTGGSSGITITDSTNKNTITLDSNGISLQPAQGNAITLTVGNNSIKLTSSSITLTTSGATLTIDSSGASVK